MNFIERLGNYLFILGALLAIFSGAFPVTPEMETIKLLLLIITGAFVGLLNIQEEKELHFLIAVGVFIVSSRALADYMADLILFSNLGEILTNFIIFSSSASVVVALKLIFTHASIAETKNEKLSFVDPKSEAAWNITIFVAVCFALIIFILEAFFYTNGLTPFLTYLSYLVILVFIIDLFILYRRSKNTTNFLKYHWADILAVIPVSGIFQLAKLFRFMRIATVLSRTTKLARISKISHSTKFFSHHSGFNKYMKK